MNATPTQLDSDGRLLARALEERNAIDPDGVCWAFAGLIISCQLVLKAIERCEPIQGEHSPRLYADELRAALEAANP